MRFKFGITVGVMCGVLTLAACSKGPSSEQEAAAGAQGMPNSQSDVSSVLADNSPNEDTVECLAVGLRHSKELLDEFVQQPRESVTANIPSGQLVYWSAGRGDGFIPGRASYCVGKLSQEERDRVKDNHYEASQLIDGATKALGIAVNEEFIANPFGVFNALMAYRQTDSVSFQPSPKGDFEKTVDYEARIAADKAKFDKANSGKKVSIQDVEYTWMGLFGSPSIKRDGISSERDLYNPDTETLSLTIVPKGYSSKQKEIGSDAPETGEWYTHYPFEIPLKIKLTPEQAQKFFNEYSVGNSWGLRPVVAMQLQKGTLVVKEVSLKDYNTFADLGFERMGFKLDHIPVNYELSRNIVPNL